MRSNQVRKLVYVIGMGPGNFEQMTFEARRALEQSDVIVGYTVYVDLLREHFPEKQFLTTPMRQEAQILLRMPRIPDVRVSDVQEYRNHRQRQHAVEKNQHGVVAGESLVEL